MRYADRQLRRPRFEHNRDYGPRNRMVLVDASGLQILVIEGGREGVAGDPERKHQPTLIVAYPDASQPDKQRVLSQGRMTTRGWERIAEEMFTFLGCEPFNVRLISRQHTLLLDALGQVTEPPTSRIPVVVQQLLDEGTVQVGLDTDGNVVAKDDLGRAPLNLATVVKEVSAAFKSAPAKVPVAVDAQSYAEQLAAADQALKVAAQNYTMLKLQETLRSGTV